MHKLTHAFYGPGGISRPPFFGGEHEGRSLPKRSDTFGGFDNGKDPSSSRGNFRSSHPTLILFQLRDITSAKILNSSQSDSKLADLEQVKDELSSSNRDSGFHSQLIMSHAADSQGSIAKSWVRRYASATFMLQ